MEKTTHVRVTFCPSADAFVTGLCEWRTSCARNVGENNFSYLLLGSTTNSFAKRKSGAKGASCKNSRSHLSLKYTTETGI